MCVRIVDARHGEGAAEIDKLRIRSLGLEQGVVCARSGDDSSAHGNRVDEVELALAQPQAGKDVAVVVDCVRRRLLRSEREGGGKHCGGNEQTGHGSEFSSRVIAVSSTCNLMKRLTAHDRWGSTNPPEDSPENE